MKIKEVEYGELQSVKFNNYSVAKRATVDDGENPKWVLDELRVSVANDLAKVVEKHDLTALKMEENRDNLKKEIEKLENRTKELRQGIMKMEGLETILKESEKARQKTKKNAKKR